MNIRRIASLALCCLLAGPTLVAGQEAAGQEAEQAAPDQSPNEPADAASSDANQGLSELDQATDLQLDLHTEGKSPEEIVEELGKVIELVESARSKGLSDENLKIAKQVQGSALQERATLLTHAIFGRRVRRREFAQRRQQALTDLRAAAQLLESPASAFLLIARLEALPGGSREAALKALEQALEDPDLDPDVRARALTIRGSLNPDEDQRLADLAEAIELDPQNLDAVRTRGLLLLFGQRIDEAVPDLKRAAELDPKHAPTFEALATALLWQENYDEALTALNKRIELGPDAPGPHTSRGRVHALQQNYDKSLADLDRSLELDPTSLETLLLRAQVRVLDSRPDAALADVDELLRVRPGLLEAMRLRAEILASEGKIGQAVEVVQELLADHPDDVDLNVQLAQYLMADTKTREAIGILNHVIEKNPKLVSALRSRGDAHLSVAKHRAAIADYETALEVDSDHSGVLNNLSWVLSTSPDDSVRDGERALELAKQACQLTNYEQGHILSTLASAYAELGDFEEAKKWSKKAVEIGNDEQKEQLKDELASYEQGKPWRELQDVEEGAEDELDAPGSNDDSAELPEGTLEF